MRFTDKELEVIENNREVLIDEYGHWLCEEQHDLCTALAAIGVWVDDYRPADWDINVRTENGKTVCRAALNPDYGCAVATRESWRTMFDHLFADYDEFSAPASDALVSAAYREWVVEVGGEYGDEQPRQLRRRFVLHGSDDDIPAGDLAAGWTVDNISECMCCSIDNLLDKFADEASSTYDFLTSDSQVWEYLCENNLLDDDEEENDDEC